MTGIGTTKGTKETRICFWSVPLLQLRQPRLCYSSIRKVTDISWFQLCDIKGERLEREYIELEPFWWRQWGRSMDFPSFCHISLKGLKGDSA
jgi:hypothetical protein